VLDTDSDARNGSDIKVGLSLGKHFYSITSPARASSAGGTVRLAVDIELRQIRYQADR